MAIEMEKIGSKETPATLFIGVGGIGSKIVVKVAERCRDKELKNLRFVCMDTNANDLRTVRNSKAKITYVQTSSTQSVGDYLKNDESAARYWFPNNSILYPKTVSEGAGQVRAISRLALNATIKTGNIQELYGAIDDLFLKDGGDLKQALRVVIASTAAGGTGSGIAMMTGMLVRDYLSKHYREKSAVVRGLLLLPGVLDTVIKSQTEQVSLRRNGYATIKEINALMMKAGGFCNVEKSLERFSKLHVEIPTTTNEVETLEALPFDFCFLLDRIDKNQESMVSLNQYIEFAAQGLYEQNVGPMQQDAFSMEDNIIKEFAKEGNYGRNRFGGIGAAILRYPYYDVIDYIAYSRALDRIGGSANAAGDWTKYDKSFVSEFNEFKKRRSMTSDKEPVRSEVYVTELNNDDKRFGMDVKAQLSNKIENVKADVTKGIGQYLRKVEDELLRAFLESPEFASLDAEVSELTTELDYEGDERRRDLKEVQGYLDSIRNYESVIKRSAEAIARSKARAIFLNSPSLGHSGIKQFYPETLFSSTDGGIHPNAMRFKLYILLQQMEELRKIAENNIQNTHFDALARFSPDNDSDDFNIDLPFEKKKEKCIDDVVRLAKDPSILEKIGGYGKLWQALNDHFVSYSNQVMAYRNDMIKAAAYKEGVKFIKMMCDEFERFYGSFERKVVELTKKKTEIVEKLTFRKGDSVDYVCATEKHLNELCDKCPVGSDGFLLPASLNVDIYEAIKSNVEIRREEENDINSDKSSVDVFDGVLINYFRESVQDDCKEVIDMNIIQAIIKEQQFSKLFEDRENNKGEDVVQSTPVSEDDKAVYLEKKIEKGQRLAAPGISELSFNEPREVSVCAFNKSLRDMQSINVIDLLQSSKLSAVSTDTVSKYDFRFFNATYNITPDKLSRFMKPDEGGAGRTKTSGIYYSAYQDFVKKIGPDSTKSMAISLHIDKRWDSISNMPELDLGVQKEEMIKIHSALAYGLIHGMIVTRPSSTYDTKKRIFELEDNEGGLTPFIVSNGTECDEFYEILDALYHDRAAVETIYKMAEDIRKYDDDGGRRMADSVFARDLSEFKIGDGHDAPTSIYEIPLLYYNSLPRHKMDDNEISLMIDSVNEVLEKEVTRFEQNKDIDAYLCKTLGEQFILLIKNFTNDEYDKKYEIRRNSTLEENPVINIVFRKVSNIFKKFQISDCDQKINMLRDLIKGNLKVADAEKEFPKTFI